ncbi:MAG TPA: putative toxin-antitoxin system toxin component, PIN family [Thauera sp.]|nr:putative toxin-antitoxin system toxin component, PIN family [Thauera sp.]
MTDSAPCAVDTSVLVSRLLAPRSSAARAVDLALASGNLLGSDETLTELTEVLARAKFDPYVSRADRREFIRLLGGVMQILPIVRRVVACCDPRDDKFLELALAGEASAIITGDKDLLVLHPWCDIPIVTPAQFIAMQASARNSPSR